MITKRFATAFLAFTLAASALSSAAMAEKSETPTAKLRASGIGGHNTAAALIGFSHDNSFIMMQQNVPASKVKPGASPAEFVIIPIRSDNKVGEIRHLPVGAPVTMIEYSMLTPDQKDLIVVSRDGASFAKLNLETGKTSTIHEHVEGKPGFRAQPQVLHMQDGKMFVAGYFYDDRDFTDVDCLATFDPNEKDVLAFDRIADIEKIEADLHVRNGVHTATDCAFYSAWKDEKKKDDIRMYVWNPPAHATPAEFDAGIEMESFWGSANRIAYTIQRSDKTYDLMLYDAKTGKKTTVAKGTKKPYINIFLSNDGSTILVTDSEHRLQRAKFFYADENTGWKLKETADLGNKTVRFGEVRLSEDGTKMAIFSKNGLTVANVKAKR